MFVRALLAVVTVCGLTSHGVCKEKTKPLPETTSGLIKLIDSDPGNSPDLGYKLLMEQGERFGKDRRRREEELANEDYEAAIDRWARRSSGITLKFALSHWERAKQASKRTITRDEIDWLVDLMGNGKYSGLSTKEWELEAKKLLPYRFRFSSPMSILTKSDLESQDAINAAIDSELPIVRARAIGVLSDRAKWRKPVDTCGIEKKLIALSRDADLGVRKAVADALGSLEPYDPKRVLPVLIRLSSDEDLSLVFIAINATRKHSQDMSPDQAADVLHATMRLSGNPGGGAVNTLEMIAQKGGQGVCDKLVDLGIQYWKTTGRGDSKVINVLAHAARGSSDDRCQQVAKVLCEAIRVSDTYDEMAAVMNVGALGKKLSPSSRATVMAQLVRIIEGRLDGRKVRINQASYAAAQIAPLCDEATQTQYVTRLRKIVDQPARSRAAALVLGSLGSAAEDAVADLQLLTRSKDGFTSVAAARAIWNIEPNAELCGRTYIQIMHSGGDYPRRAAMAGLIEMGTDALVVGDEMVELLKHKRCCFLIEDVFEKLGPAASELASKVTPLLQHEQRHARSAAEKVLPMITALSK